MTNNYTKHIIDEINNDIEKRYHLSGDIIAISKFKNIFYVIKETLIKYQKNDKFTSFDVLKEIIEGLIQTNCSVGMWSVELGNIRVFPDSIMQIYQDNFLYLYELVITLYHEMNHKLKLTEPFTTKDFTTLENFIILLEELICDETSLYITNHRDGYSDFYQEIIANVDSVEKAKQFFKSKPQLYNKLKYFLENRALIYKIDLVNYDLEQFINYLTLKIQNKKTRSRFLQKSKFSNIAQMLYNSDGKFKTISELYKDEQWQSLDKEIQYTVIASKSFLEQQELKKLSLEELNLIFNSLTYAHNQALNRKYNNQLLEQEIKKFNKEVPQSFEENFILMPKFIHKEQRTILKIAYLEKVMFKVSLLIHNQPSIPKQKTRTITGNKNHN